jgi:hypothetical protein
MELTAVLTLAEDGGYIALNPETARTSGAAIVRVGTLAGILRQAGISPEDFVDVV